MPLRNRDPVHPDPYLRAAVKRLGEVSADGAVTLQDGTRFDTSVPLELSAAANQAAEARGFLALLRQFVAELEPPAYRRPTLRGLVAPEVGSDRFDAIVETAEIREHRCLAQRGQASARSTRKEVREALRR